MASVLLSVALITAIETGQFAEAKMTVDKQQRHKYYYWVGNKVCGDKLCEGTSYHK